MQQRKGQRDTGQDDIDATALQDRNHQHDADEQISSPVIHRVMVESGYRNADRHGKRREPDLTGDLVVRPHVGDHGRERRRHSVGDLRRTLPAGTWGKMGDNVGSASRSNADGV